MKPKMFFLRIKDTFIPPDLRARVRVTKNKYDCLLFDQGYLLTLELKSTGNKSVSFDEKIIKQHQIDNLLEASTYENTISGFLFNFREYDNKTYFVHIQDFVKYQHTAQGKSSHTYKSKVNKSSISLDICEEIGIELKNYLKKKNYHYHVRIMIDEAIKKYCDKDNPVERIVVV
ncbi:hypothetical protein [Paenibacillus cremeus]|uniref:Uncharacterized protein n=1 Tax=Paenibacillus cremeus TaxID=2163881 RepID=A0A559KCF0_9BACL|nr:hypothetical protein FPZ49_10600 [Paenibacillus cremeus]